MKTTSFLFAAILIAAPLAHVARAQDNDVLPTSDLNLRATDPAGRSEPSVLIPSESSRSYPKPGTPLNTPRPSPSPSPVAAAASSPEKTRAAASPTPAKAPSPAATAAATTAATTATTTPAGKTNVAAAIRALEARWAASIAAHDATVPQQLVAADYIGVNSAGRVVNKAALLADMKRDKNTYESAVNSGVTVRVHGNTAVAVGTTRQTGKTPAGEAFTYSYRWTDTWLERNGQWQCVGSQSFLVTR
jgi:ketosteroid isomerase-like protein